MERPATVGAIVLHGKKFSAVLDDTNSFTPNNQKPRMIFDKCMVGGVNRFKYFYPIHFN
jgi:hypothetical protein